MNAVKSIKSKIVALVAVLVLAVAVMPAQAQFDQPPHEYPEYPVSAGCLDAYIFEICVYVNPQLRIGQVVINAVDGAVQDVKIFALNSNVNLHIDFGFNGYGIEMDVRAHWRNKFVRVQGSAYTPNSSTSFIRNLSWDSGNQGY